MKANKQSLIESQNDKEDFNEVLQIVLNQMHNLEASRQNRTKPEMFQRMGRKCYDQMDSCGSEELLSTEDESCSKDLGGDTSDKVSSNVSKPPRPIKKRVMTRKPCGPHTLLLNGRFTQDVCQDCELVQAQAFEDLAAWGTNVYSNELFREYREMQVNARIFQGKKNFLKQWVQNCIKGQFYRQLQKCLSSSSMTCECGGKVSKTIEMARTPPLYLVCLNWNDLNRIKMRLALLLMSLDGPFMIESTQQMLKGIVCSQLSSHQICLFRQVCKSGVVWVLFNDETQVTQDYWEEVVDECVQCQYVPTSLLFGCWEERLSLTTKPDQIKSFIKIWLSASNEGKD